MSKVLVVTGKTGSGKSLWISKWYGESPDQRRITSVPQDIQRFVGEGLDVAIEVSYPEAERRLALVTRMFAGQPVEVEEVRVA